MKKRTIADSVSRGEEVAAEPYSAIRKGTRLHSASEDHDDLEADDMNDEADDHVDVAATISSLSEEKRLRAQLQSALDGLGWRPNQFPQKEAEVHIENMPEFKAWDVVKNQGADKRRMTASRKGNCVRFAATALKVALRTGKFARHRPVVAVSCMFGDHEGIRKG